MTVADDPAPATAAPPRIAILLKGYPRLSETFIAQELLALEGRGLPLAIWSLRHPTDPARHPMHERIRASVAYLPEYLREAPLRVLAGLLSALRRPRFPALLALFARDLARDASANRLRRLGQALVLARDLPETVVHLHAHFLHTPASVARYCAVLTGRSWSFSAHAKDIWTTPDWDLSEKLAEAAWGVTCTRDGLMRLASLMPPVDPDPSVLASEAKPSSLSRRASRFPGLLRFARKDGQEFGFPDATGIHPNLSPHPEVPARSAGLEENPRSSADRPLPLAGRGRGGGGAEGTAALDPAPPPPPTPPHTQVGPARPGHLGCGSRASPRSVGEERSLHPAFSRMSFETRSLAAALAVLTWATAAQAAPAAYPNQKEADLVVKDFRFASGESLPEVRLHYATLGTPHRDAAGEIDNAVLALHGTTGTGKLFLNPSLGPELFGEGAPLDAGKYFVILPDGLGRGGSSKPSDGLKGRFPRYGYADVVAGQHRVVTEGLGIKRLRLVLGTSMGGMQAWMWGERYPDMMDAIVAVASQPIPVSGRNALWRRLLTESIRSDPDWKDGDYTQQPTHFQKVLPIFNLMTESVIGLQRQAPSYEAAMGLYDELATGYAGKADANDWLYWFESSFDYDPGPALDRIKARVLAINFADDELNPPQLDVMEGAMAKVAAGRFVLVPASAKTHGHQSLRFAALWKEHLAAFLADAARERAEESVGR